MHVWLSPSPCAVLAPRRRGCRRAAWSRQDLRSRRAWRCWQDAEEQEGLRTCLCWDQQKRPRAGLRGTAANAGAASQGRCRRRFILCWTWRSCHPVQRTIKNCQGICQGMPCNTQHCYFFSCCLPLSGFSAAISSSASGQGHGSASEGCEGRGVGSGLVWVSGRLRERCLGQVATPAPGCWTQDREEEGNIPVWLPGRCLGALQQGSGAGEAGKVPLARLVILT